MYDKDASGYIDFKELRSIMLDHATGINLTADDIKALFKRFDADDDKRVSRKEFFLFYRNVWDGEVNFELNLFSTSIGSRR